MRRFNCLAVDCPILGPHVLEASAGTGKTFAIEHVVVRLLLEGLPIEEILVVTFTRAATRELKERIYATLQKAHTMLQSDEEALIFPYLMAHLGSQEALFLLALALKGFDQAQIFTIHGFCHRMLTEFAFEAHLTFSIPNPDERIDPFGKMKRFFPRFWEEGILSEDLCSEQLALLLGKYETVSQLQWALFEAKREKILPFFQRMHQQFVQAVRNAPYVSHLQEDFERVKGQYKGMKKGFDAQIELLSQCLEHPENVQSFRDLLLEKGSIFQFIDPENKKKRRKEEVVLTNPEIFDWMVQHLDPIIKEACSQKAIFAALASCWTIWEETNLSEEVLFQPDELIVTMKKALAIPPFLHNVQKKYKAVIIDEFQDTDPLQWEIFQKAFVGKDLLKALYLVGDPKQSIYRFRNADVYTYYRAKEALGLENLYHLDTNFRSSKQLVGALNALFCREFLPLPKLKSSIAYTPVASGAEVQSELLDEKKALHFMIGKGSFEDLFLPYTVKEILKLQHLGFGKMAILVRNRYELQSTLEALKAYDIPCVGREHQGIQETFAFQAIQELFQWVQSPGDLHLKECLKYGPFALYLEDVRDWKHDLEEKGLALFFGHFLREETPFEKDLMQILEILFRFEKQEGFSFPALKRWLQKIQNMDAKESYKRSIDVMHEAVQVLTLHVSKGLEFDIVFALGLSTTSASEEIEEEFSAEKLRQLYVAMTRARVRLYVPLDQGNPKKGLSPMKLFQEQLESQEGPMMDYLMKLSDQESISIESLSCPIELPEKVPPLQGETTQKVSWKKVSYKPQWIQSFSSLSQDKVSSDAVVEATSFAELPRGKETGLIIHHVFEAIFRAKECDLHRVIEETLQHSSLAPYVESVETMIRQTLEKPLFDGEKTFSLQEVDRANIYPELEFLYQQGENYLKGFIDLIFVYEQKFYLIDWKTNVLKDDSEKSMREVISAHGYDLQTSIYEEALRRHLGSRAEFGGSFFFFVRENCYIHF